MVAVRGDCNFAAAHGCRICKNEATIEINVPHPRHDNYISDPKHVRILAPQLLSLFDRRLNDEWKKSNAASTLLAHYLHIDFVVTKAMTVLAAHFGQLFHNGKLLLPRWIHWCTRETKWSLNTE